LIGGEVQVLLTNMASLLPHAKSGRIKMLGISSPKRSPLAPEVPTIAGAGVPRFEYTTWYGMLAPRATPQPVVAHLYKSVAKVLQAPQVKEKFSGQGLEVYASTPGEFEKYLAAEIEKWDKVVKAAGIKAE
jgi:tripartite-type tricarboxylate transporter receptor subunit TctC